MAKRRIDVAPAEDYIDQLEWKARHRRGVPVRFEPKWKYKIIYRFQPISPIGRALRIALLMGGILLLVYLVGSDMIVKQVGTRIFFGLIFGLIVIILFFAVRDASKETDDDSDDTN